MKHTTKQADRFLKAIRATKNKGVLIPFAVGRLTSQINLVNMKPRSSHATLKSNLLDFEGWDGTPKAPVGKTDVTQVVLGYLTLQDATLLIKSKASRDKIEGALEKYFVKGLKRAVPWEGVDVREETATDETLAAAAPSEEELLASVSEADGDATAGGAATPSGAESLPPSTTPAFSSQEGDTSSPELIRRPPDIAPAQPTILSELSRLADRTIEKAVAMLPSMGRAGAGSRANVEAIDGWLRRNMADVPAGEREERASNGMARVILGHPLGDAEDYHLEVTDPTASGLTMRGERPALKPVRVIDLAPLGFDTLQKPEAANRLYEEVRSLALRNFTLFDLDASRPDSIVKWVNNNWPQPDAEVKGHALTTAGKLFAEAQAMLQNNPKATAIMLGIAGRPLSPEAVETVLDNIFVPVNTAIENVKAKLQKLIDATEALPVIRENGGIAGLGGNWDKIYAISEALRPINPKDRLKEMMKDPRELSTLVQTVRRTCGDVLASPLAKQVDNPPFSDAPSGSCGDALTELAPPLRAVKT